MLLLNEIGFQSSILGFVKNFTNKVVYEVGTSVLRLSRNLLLEMASKHEDIIRASAEVTDQKLTESLQEKEENLKYIFNSTG